MRKRFCRILLCMLITVCAHAQDSPGNIEIYGAIIMDAGYDFNSIDPVWFDMMRPSKLPSYKGQFGPEGNAFFGVRQTKLGVKSRMHTAAGVLKTHFDFDLVGFGKDAGQTTFHLVNAYAQLGRVGAGQTASVFMDLDVFPNTLDYWGPLSRVFFLNTQVRFVVIEKAHEKLLVALERPGGTADGGDYRNSLELQQVKPVFDLPNLTAQYRKGGKWGYVQAAGILKSIQWEDLDPAGFDLSGSDVGWGFNLGTVLHAGPRLRFKLQGVAGEGIENYIADVTPDVGLQSRPGNGSTPFAGAALPVWGFFSFAEIKWTPRLESSAGYSMLTVSNSDLQSANAFRKGQYAAANLRWYPIKNLMAGIEYQYGRRDNFSDGFHSVGNKIQLMVEANFQQIFKGVD